MLKDDYIDLLCDLIRTPSFSREETAACDLLERWMLAHGLTPERRGNNLTLEQTRNKKQETRNQKPETGNQKPETILLNAHIDTVHPAASYTRNPMMPTREGDRIYGLGSNDDLGSLIALLATYIDLKDTLPCRLLFSATAEEEVSGKGGVDMVLNDWGNVDLGIVGEPTGMRMAIAERGLLVLDCTAQGVSGHAARNEGVNALYKAIDDIQWFRSFQFGQVSPYLGAVKMSVTMIDAGTQHNQIPDTCHFVVDIRSNGLYTNQQILDIVTQHVSCDVKARSTRLNASHISEQHRIVQCARALGLETFGSPTTSNQTLMPFPTVKIGPGDSARSHAADEYICLSEIEQAIILYKQLLTSYLQ